MSSRPNKQDYIAKTRYINNLPPPPLNPKFIKYHTTDKITPEQEASQILSSAFRKDNFIGLIKNIDVENGMNLNLINNRGVLDNHDYLSISRQTDRVELHPNDRVLLRNAGIDNISKTEPEVSFLRRTEYFGQRSMPQKAIDLKSNDTSANDNFDSETQLKAVEATFEAARKSLTDLNSLKHPSKKHLKAVNTWQLLPGTSMFDAKFLVVKFNGSASLSRDLKLAKSQDDFDSELHTKLLETSLFKPITSADGEWMSLYQQKITESTEIDKLHQSLNSPEPEKPNVDDDNQHYNFKFYKNYDMNFQKFPDLYEELAIQFVNDNQSKKRKIGYYYPITGKIDLRKYRKASNTQINKFVNESTYDAVDFTLREPTTAELRKMDAIRSDYDPMEYEGEEELEPDTAETNETKQDDKLNVENIPSASNDNVVN